MREGWAVLKSRLLRLALWAVASLVLIWVLAWLAVPRLLKWQLESRGSEALGRELRVGDVQFVPHALALTLRDLSIAGAEAAAPPQLHVDRVFVDLDVRSLWRLAPVVQALEIDAPHARLARLAEGRYDIDDVLQRLARSEPQPPSETPRFALFNVRVSDGQLQFDDRPVARQHLLRKLVLDLPFLSNLPDDLLVKVEPRLAFEFNGSAFDNRGRSTPFAEGRASEFEIRFDGLDLQPMWAYAPDGLPLQPAGGALSADLNLRFEQPRQGEPRIDLRGQLGLRDFSLRLPGDAPLLAWQNLSVRLADVRPLQRRVALDAVQLDGAILHLRREASGGLELQRLAAAFPAGAASAPPATTPDWQLQLALLELKGAKLQWSDAALQPGAELQLDGIDLQLKQLSWPVTGDASLRVDARVVAQDQPVGRLHAEGALTDQQAKVDLQADGIELSAVEPSPFFN